MELSEAESQLVHCPVEMESSLQQERGSKSKLDIPDYETTAPSPRILILKNEHSG